MGRKRKTAQPWLEEELAALPSSRREAKSVGAKLYYTGKHCKYDHFAPLYTSTSQCHMCGQIRAARAYQKDPEKGKQKNKLSHQKHRTKRLAGLKRYKAENPEVIKRLNDARDKEAMRLAAMLWRAMNPQKAKESQKRAREKRREKRKDESRAWRAKNSERVIRYNKSYKLRHKERIRKYDQAHYQKARRQMPGWADAKAIIEIYEERDRLNARHGKFSYHVDHVIPLHGKWHGEWVVCGLHVANNLEIVKRELNLAKGASYDPVA